MSQYIALFLIPVSALVFLGLGCNPMQKAQDAVAQKAGDAIAGGLLSQASGGEVKVDSDAGNVSFKDNKTGDIVLFGEDVKVPAEFPKDVFIYDGVKVLSVQVRASDLTANISLTSTDDPAKVLAWYATKFKNEGWTEKESATMNQVELRTYEKGKFGIALSVWPQKEKDVTYITLSRTVDNIPPDQERSAE